MYNPLLFAGLEKVTIEIADKERYVCNVCIISNVKCITLLIPALIKPSIIWKDSNLPLSNRPSCGLDPLKCSMVILAICLFYWTLFILYISHWGLAPLCQERLTGCTFLSITILCIAIYVVNNACFCFPQTNVWNGSAEEVQRGPGEKAWSGDSGFEWPFHTAAQVSIH